MSRISVLFTMPGSIYHTIPGADCWGLPERDALEWPGGSPIVAHPPCRLWGRLRAFSTAPRSEKARPSEIPAAPFRIGEPTHHIGGKWRNSDGRYTRSQKRPLPKSERSATPEPMARWLVEVARACRAAQLSHDAPSYEGK